MRYTHVLFDLDGTLTDPKEGITKSIQYALEQVGIIEPDLDKFESFIGPPLKDSFMNVYGMTAKEAEDAIRLYRVRFSDKGLYENIVYPGIADLLSELKRTGIHLAVATSKPTVFAAQILEHFELDSCFDYVLGSELDGTRCAKAEVVKEVLAHFADADRVRCVMVGDRSYDMAGAKSCGIDSIGVLYGYGSKDELRASGASKTVESVEELGFALSQ